MKLLIVTQIIDKNDPILGFFHRWVEEFAKHCEQVVVICLKKGAHELPENVRVISLGKEEGVSRWTYLVRFYKYIWTERKNYDAVFVHMNPEYVVLGGVLWICLSKKVTLWYTHGSVSIKLRIASMLAHTIFTASKESFRIPTMKVQVVGHGIDTDLFKFRKKSHNPTPRLLSVGRISAVKRQELAIETLAELRRRKADAALVLVGIPLTMKDKVYQSTLLDLAEKEGVAREIIWRGSVANNDLPFELAQADVLVHTSETGSLDKVVLEALAAGVFVVTTSRAVCANIPANCRTCILSEGTSEALANAVLDFLSTSRDTGYAAECHSFVATSHSLPVLISRIVGTIRS